MVKSVVVARPRPSLRELSGAALANLIRAPFTPHHPKRASCVCISTWSDDHIYSGRSLCVQSTLWRFSLSLECIRHRLHKVGTYSGSRELIQDATCSRSLGSAGGANRSRADMQPSAVFHNANLVETPWAPKIDHTLHTYFQSPERWLDCHCADW